MTTTIEPTLLATTVANALIKKCGKSGVELPLQTFRKDGLTFHYWVDEGVVYVKAYTECGELLEVRQAL